MKSKAKRLATKSRPVYASRLRRFCQYLEYHPAFGQVQVDVAIKSLSLIVVEDFLISLDAKGLMSSTVRGYEITIREFCKWLCSSQSGYALKQDLYANQNFISRKPVTRLPNLTDASTVIKLLSRLNFEEHRLVAHFIYDTGLRISEVPRVLKSDIPNPTEYPPDTAYYPLFVSGSKGPKDQPKGRVTIISRAMVSRIQKYHNSKQYLQKIHKHTCESRNMRTKDYPAFLNTEGNPMKVDAIENFIRDASIRAQLRLSAHKLRHGTAYSILRSELAPTLIDKLVLVQKILGHANLSTTEIYTRVPATALVRGLSGAANSPINFRFEEAQRIFDETYIPAHLHQRKRRGLGGIYV